MRSSSFPRSSVRCLEEPSQFVVLKVPATAHGSPTEDTKYDFHANQFQEETFCTPAAGFLLSFGAGQAQRSINRLFTRSQSRKPNGQTGRRRTGGYSICSVRAQVTSARNHITSARFKTRFDSFQTQSQHHFRQPPLLKRTPVSFGSVFSIA